MVIGCQSADSRVVRVEKLIANLQNTASWQLSTLYWKLSNLARYLPCDFSVDVPFPETTQHRDTHDWSSVLSTRHWTVQFSEAAWSSTTGSIITSQGKYWSKTTRQTSSNFNKPPTYVHCTRRFTICNSNRHISETSSISCRAIQREKGIHRQRPERRKMSEEKRETKKSTSCRYASTQTESNWLLRKGESCI